ncbi:hypothetical protein B0H13DRAFT_1911686 [Mycena leptocephala]|nr:hypothetical protein B0H13DRAFT_1911686 [Mycena leptocephala]
MRHRGRFEGTGVARKRQLDPKATSPGRRRAREVATSTPASLVAFGQDSRVCERWVSKREVSWPAEWDEQRRGGERRRDRPRWSNRSVSGRRTRNESRHSEVTRLLHLSPGLVRAKREDGFELAGGDDDPGPAFLDLGVFRKTHEGRATPGRPKEDRGEEQLEGDADEEREVSTPSHYAVLLLPPAAPSTVTRWASDVLRGGTGIVSVLVRCDGLWGIGVVDRGGVAVLIGGRINPFQSDSTCGCMPHIHVVFVHFGRQTALNSYGLCFFDASIELKAGRRVTVNKPNSTYATHYAHYNTHYHPSAHDGMVVFAACSAQSTAVEPATNSLPTNTLTLDAMTFFVLPGSPDSDTYNPNNAIQSYGVCRELSPTGILLLKVDSTALNISSNALAPSDDHFRLCWLDRFCPSYAIETEEVRSYVPSSFCGQPGLSLRFLYVDAVRERHHFHGISPSSECTNWAYAHSQLFQQCPQYMPQPTGAFLPPFLPPQGLYSMPGYLTFSRREYTLPPSVDSRASTSTRDSGSTDISSAFVASPLTVPVQDNSAFNRSAANPYSYPMTQIASTSQSNTPTSVQPSSSSAPVPAAHSIQPNLQPAKPSGSTSTGSSAGVSTLSRAQTFGPGS